MAQAVFTATADQLDWWRIAALLLGIFIGYLVWGR